MEMQEFLLGLKKFIDDRYWVELNITNNIKYFFIAWKRLRSLVI